jgi:hypothetical protein
MRSERPLNITKEKEISSFFSFGFGRYLKVENRGRHRRRYSYRTTFHCFSEREREYCLGTNFPALVIVADI